jgi:uracil-DNA glycosylase family 4
MPRRAVPLSLTTLTETIVACRRCPRLVEWRELVAREKRASYRDQEYWGKPIPGFGDPMARLLIVGLAPAAHGGNRTGRVFTGDRSGDWLFASLHRAGFANQPTSVHRDDGLALSDCYIAACVRCAPPANRPTIDERDACLGYLREEVTLLPSVRAIVCLGSFAWDGLLRVLRQMGHSAAKKPRFGHRARAAVGQNTFTGRLTEPMLDAVWADARALLAG